MTLGEMVLKLFLALLLGGLVGLERERRDRPAGLRTHILVCVGSTLITLVSISLAGSRADPTRIAAQIVSGIGFLGAGTIFLSGATVRGLTTAAGIWAVAGIGMAVAAGGSMLLLAAITAVMIFVVNEWGRRLEDRMTREYREVVLTLSPGEDALAHILQGLEERGIVVRQVRWLSGDGSSEQGSVRLRLELPSSTQQTTLTGLAAWMSSLGGVRQAEWE
jgi:putative Mg2+ transporter-C (MgtC) family protein